MTKVSVYHSIMPHLRTSRSEPVRLAWKRSAAKTPIWQVTELNTRMVVLPSANGKFNTLEASPHASAPATDRCVKYMANSPAKNISSLESQMMTPTDRTLGRLTCRSEEHTSELQS